MLPIMLSLGGGLDQILDGDVQSKFQKDKLKSKTFGRKTFGEKTSGKKLSDAFSGISDKKLSDKHDIKKQALLLKYMLKIIVSP